MKRQTSIKSSGERVMIKLITALIDWYYNRKHMCKNGLHSWNTDPPGVCVCGDWEHKDRWGDE